MCVCLLVICLIKYLLTYLIEFDSIGLSVPSVLQYIVQLKHYCSHSGDSVTKIISSIVE